MLVSLSIRNIVLIERLDLQFTAGLSVLTGETGAGKSILLDSLGLAVGARGGPDLIRQKADKGQVIAEFDVPEDHPALVALRGQDLDAGTPLILRRQLDRAGRGRAYINDQPVSVGMLRTVGDALLEIQGQFEMRGLLDPSTHRETLDESGELKKLRKRTAAAWSNWKASIKQREQAEADLEKAAREEEFLRFAVDEINQLNPQPGEEKQLADTRSAMMHHEKLVDALNAAMQALTGTAGAEPESTASGVTVEDSLRAAEAQLAKVEQYSESRIAPALAALQSASAEATEAINLLHALVDDLELDPQRQDQIEERLFTLRALARKHNSQIDNLPALRDAMTVQLAALTDDGANVETLRKLESEARQAYVEIAETLSRARQDAASALDAAVTLELPPLKLEKAVFATRIDRLPETQWGSGGIDSVVFEVATNPGAPPGPVNKIASGGELSRFMLAIKVTLARKGQIDTLIFDEVDAGVGGATAAAVGERLTRLAENVQVLVVTHSPQVAAHGSDHWRIEKTQTDAASATTASQILGSQRREEIARMISGATITDEARAAADKLLETGNDAGREPKRPADDLFAASGD